MMASAGLFESKERGTVLQRQEFHPFRNVHLRKNESIREGGKAKQKQQQQQKKGNEKRDERRRNDAVKELRMPALKNSCARKARNKDVK